MGGGDEMGRIDGGAGADTAHGGTGNDQLLGGDGIDWRHGEPGNDRLEGNNDADSLHGGEGGDALPGGAGNDLLQAGEGGDVLRGGAGADLITLWEGTHASDNLIFNRGDSGRTLGTIDRVEDLTSALTRFFCARTVRCSSAGSTLSAWWRRSTTMAGFCGSTLTATAPPT